VLRCQVNSEVEISVTDEGPGIAPALLPHVFEPFFRGQKQSPPGTNLGAWFVDRSGSRASDEWSMRSGKPTWNRYNISVAVAPVGGSSRT